MNRRVQARMFRTNMLGAGWVVTVTTPIRPLGEVVAIEPIESYVSDNQHRDIARGMSTIMGLDLIIAPNAASPRALTRAASAVTHPKPRRQRMVYSYLNPPTREYL